jgi:hypothetical protein
MPFVCKPHTKLKKLLGRWYDDHQPMFDIGDPQPVPTLLKVARKAGLPVAKVSHAADSTRAS